MVTEATPPPSRAGDASASAHRVGARGIVARAWGLVLAAWGAFTGALPHVLHHVGPLAGTALVAGVGGRALFGGVGLVAAAPLLLRLYRRFQTWVAPAIALGVFIAMFALSTFVVGPLISGTSQETPQPAGQATALDEHGH